MVNDQIKAKTGTSSKLKKMYENSSKNTQSRLLVGKKSKKIIGSTRIQNGKVKKFNITSGKRKSTSCLSGS